MRPLCISVSMTLLLIVSGFRHSIPRLYDDDNGLRAGYNRDIFSGKMQRTGDDNPSNRKLESAVAIAKSFVALLVSSFTECIGSKTNEWTGPGLETVISIPQKTTVGFAPKFTLNRKFFGNLIQTRAFKDMLENDALLVKRNIVRAMKTCDSLILNQDVIKTFYDREADQMKI